MITGTLSQQQSWAQIHMQAAVLVLFVGLSLMLALGRGFLTDEDDTASGQICTYFTIQGHVTQRLRDAPECPFVAIVAGFGAASETSLP